MEKYLIKYLLENEQDDLIRKYIEYSRVELDWFIYNYGDHISKTHCRDQSHNFRKKKIQLAQNWSARINYHKSQFGLENIFSCVLVPDLQSDYNFYSSVLQPVRFTNIIGGNKAIRLRKRKNIIVYKGEFLDLLNKNYIEEWESYKSVFLKEISPYSFKGAFFPTDQYFEDKYLMDIFKELGIPTFIFVHGLPGVYSLDLENRSDYLMVWGQRMKEHYINTGFNQNKIYVTGNRHYSQIDYNQKLRNELDDVLVIPPSDLLWHQNTWGEPILMDRSMSILYLYQVEKELKKIGVNHARFRVHPSINSSWTYSFLDHDFYTIDKMPLSKSLSEATMVIGAASTVLLDAIIAGVNYVMYEPQENGKCSIGLDAIPPFDGGDNIEVAKNTVELNSLLKERYVIEPKKLKGYIEPFNKLLS